MGRWRAELLPEGEGPGIAVYQGAVRVTVRPPPGNIVTDWALLPPQPTRKVPILAVASHELGQPLLALYNAASGEQLRQLTGHVERISSLAFSGDGRLLVSTGDDRTVCVWSLTTLNKVLGQIGLLDGLVVVKGDKGGAVVREVRKDSPAADQLKEDDVIEAIIIGDKVCKVDSPAQYYEAITAVKPDPAATVKLRIRGAAGLRTLPVGQGIDEPQAAALAIPDGRSRLDRLESGRPLRVQRRSGRALPRLALQYGRGCRANSVRSGRRVSQAILPRGSPERPDRQRRVE